MNTNDSVNSVISILSQYGFIIGKNCNICCNCFNGIDVLISYGLDNYKIQICDSEGIKDNTNNIDYNFFKKNKFSGFKESDRYRFLKEYCNCNISMFRFLVNRIVSNY